MTSLEAEIHNIFQKIKSCTEVETEKRFLEFINSTIVAFPNILSLEKETVRLQAELSKCKGECNSLQMKLKNAKVMLDDERGLRNKIEQEKYDLEKQVNLVVDLLGKGNFNETKERLQLLSSTFNGLNSASETGRGSLRDIMSPNPLSTINENDDSNGTIFTVSDVDMTDGDDLEVSTTRSGRPFRRSSPRQQKRKSSKSPDRSRRSFKKKSFDEGTMPKQNLLQEITNQNIQPQSVLYPSAPPLSSDEYEHKENTPYASRYESPMKSRHQNSVRVLVNTPGGGLYSSPTNSPRNYSSSRINARPHSFVSKTVYLTDFCQPCGKRLMFGKVSLKCRDCRSTCHPECHDSVPLPCIPNITSTPANKMGLGVIADFAPKIPPMVPAIIVHCTNEVENRGLNEVGIYRVPGSDREVKELKDRFMRGKGTPALSKYDVYVICGAVKDFLRHLKEPLVTYTLWRDFVSATEKTEQQDGQACLFQAISDLPQPNRDTLAWVICHLQRVAECVECKMPATNLSKVFGPTIVGYSSTDIPMLSMLDETRKQQKVMEKLLEISNDYWRTFITIPDVPIEKFHTPENNRRRRSLLSIVPMAANRNVETPRRYNSRK